MAAPIVSHPESAVDIRNGISQLPSEVHSPSKAIGFLQKHGEDVRTVLEALSRLAEDAATIQTLFTQKDLETRDVLEDINQAGIRNKEELEKLRDTHNGEKLQNLDLYCIERQKSDGEKKKLETEVEQLKAELANERGTIAQMSTKGANAEKKVKELLAEIEQSAESLQQVENAYKRLEKELKKSKDSAQQALTRANDLEDERNSLLDEIHKLSRELQAETDELAGLKSTYRELDKTSPKVMEKELKTACTEVIKTVTAVIGSDIDSQVDNMSFAWTEFSQAVACYADVPLYPSNSKDAKLMRTVSVMAYVAHKLSTEVLVLTPFIENDLYLRSALVNEADENRGGEHLLRAVLTSLQPDHQVRAMEGRIGTLVEDVMKFIRHLRFKAETLRNFETSFAASLTKLWEVWSKLIACEQKVENDGDTERCPGWEWQTFPKKITDDARTSRDSAADIVAVVFPRIYMVLQDHVTPLYSGLVVRESQTLQAAKERDEQPPASPNARRRASFSFPKQVRTDGQLPPATVHQWSKPQRTKAFLAEFS